MLRNIGECSTQRHKTDHRTHAHIIPCTALTFMAGASDKTKQYAISAKFLGQREQYVCIGFYLYCFKVVTSVKIVLYISP